MPHPPIYAKSKSWRDFTAPRYWPSWFGFGLMRLITLLPLPLIWFISAILGEVLFVLVPSRRKVTLRNIEACFPELSARKVRKVARQNYRGMIQGFFDVAIGWWASPRRLRNLVTFHNRDIYDKALAEGRPIILLMGHFLAIEVAGMVLSLERPMTDIYKKPSNEVAHLLSVYGRYRAGMGSLIEKNEGLKPVIRALRAGEPLCYLPDQDPGNENSVFVPFLGVQTATYSILGKLAKMTDAVVIPCYARQLSFGRGYDVVFEPPLENFPCGDDYQDTLHMSQVLEGIVRTMPEQYFWAHRRFKTRPPGAPDFYA